MVTLMFIIFHGYVDFAAIYSHFSQDYLLWLEQTTI